MKLTQVRKLQEQLSEMKALAGLNGESGNLEAITKRIFLALPFITEEEARELAYHILYDFGD